MKKTVLMTAALLLALASGCGLKAPAQPQETTFCIRLPEETSLGNCDAIENRSCLIHSRGDRVLRVLAVDEYTMVGENLQAAAMWAASFDQMMRLMEAGTPGLNYIMQTTSAGYRFTTEYDYEAMATARSIGRAKGSGPAQIGIEPFLSQDLLGEDANVSYSRLVGKLAALGYEIGPREPAQ